MRSRIVVAITVALGALQAAAAPLTLDEIVARYIEARGGLANLRALKSLRLVGKTRFGGEGFALESDFASLAARPGRYRAERTLQGLTAVRAWDGKQGWAMSPFRGRREPER